MKNFFCLFVILLSLSSCNNLNLSELDKTETDIPDQKAPEADNQDSSKMAILEGLAPSGDKKSCIPKLDLVCIQNDEENEAFIEDCETNGREAIGCDCGDYICVGEGLKSGLDIDGNEKSCFPASKDLWCTTVYGPQDEFANTCKLNGFEAVKCGCHDYICVYPLVD